MSTRHAESGHPTGHSRRDRSPEVHRITSAPEPGHVDRDARFVRYAWQMGIRTLCFVLAFFTTGWLQVVFFIAAIVLPYIAVVMANNGAVSNGAVLDAVPPQDRPQLTNRLQLTAGADTVPGTTTDEPAPDTGTTADTAAETAPETSAGSGSDRADGTTGPDPAQGPDRGRGHWAA